jgi:hypothetical protein
MSERKLLPEGQYTAVATSTESYVQFGTSSLKKTPQVVVNFEIVGGEYAGHRVPWVGFFSEKTATRTIEALRYMGFKGDDLMDALAQQLNNQVTIVVEHNSYADKETGELKTNARVAWVNKTGASGGMQLKEPMKTNELRTFAAKMKGLVKGVGEVEGTKPKAASSDDNDTDMLSF